MPVTWREPPVSERIETAPLVMAFLRNFSMEITRPSDAELAELKSVLPARSRVYVPAIPNRPQSELIAAATRVRAQGFEPVPHIAARRIASREALEDLLSRLSTWANVRRARHRRRLRQGGRAVQQRLRIDRQRPAAAARRH